MAMNTHEWSLQCFAVQSGTASGDQWQEWLCEFSVAGSSRVCDLCLQWGQHCVRSVAVVSAFVNLVKVCQSYQIIVHWLMNMFFHEIRDLVVFPNFRTTSISYCWWTLIFPWYPNIVPRCPTIVQFSWYQWEFQDPKMEVLYHIRLYFGGISLYIGLT